MSRTQIFTTSFNGQRFSDVYSFKHDVENILVSNESQDRVNQLKSLDDSGTGETFKSFKTEQDGVISYTVDGYTGIKLGAVDDKVMNRADYAEKESANNRQIKAGDPAYKLVTSETWSVVIQLSDNAVEEMKEKTKVKVRIAKDDFTMWAAFSMKERTDGQMYGYLTFDKSMIRYISDRYLDVELILEDQAGLKIPKSAKVSKSFFVIPQSYLTQGGNSQETGVLRMDENQTPVFTAAEIYYRDEAEGLVYLDPEAFESKTVLAKQDSSDTLILGDKRSLDGVYNINKGYAVFKQIEILSKSGDYYIVKEGNSYSLSNYDHIALDGKSLREHDIVF